jgi:hypothetical protein
VTLIVVAAACTVLLTVLRPFLDAGLKNTYNRVFVLGITGSALWLAVALFHHSDPLVDLFRSGVMVEYPGEARSSNLDRYPSWNPFWNSL